jgi:hypothetical protein
VLGPDDPGGRGIACPNPGDWNHATTRFTGACADLAVPMFIHPDAKPDSHLAGDFAAELWWDARTKQADIAVSVEDGVVRLRGTVPDVEIRQAAEATARRVYGVQAIVYELTIGEATATRPARRPPAPPPASPGSAVPLGRAARSCGRARSSRGWPASFAKPPRKLRVRSAAANGFVVHV